MWPDRAGRQGFALLEALIAMAILSVMLLGSLTALVNLQHTVNRNTMRDEAVKLGQERVSSARSIPYASLINGTTTLTYTRQITNVSAPFTVQETIADVVIGLSRSVTYAISWSYKGANYSYTAATIVGAT